MTLEPEVLADLERIKRERIARETTRINGSSRHESKDKTRATRFPLLPFAEIRPGKSSAYLVKGLLPRVGIAVVWGPPKCGKSFWTFDLVMHISLGWIYRKRRVQRGSVVYCAFEGAEGFKARVQAFRQAHNIESDAPVPFYLMPTRANLVKDHGALIVSIRTQSVAPAVVVLDTLNRSLAGSESNDQDMTAYVNAADAIREAFNCLVVIVHHCGVDGTRPRGHTSLTGTADAQLAVKRDTADEVVVTIEHMKDGPEGDQITSRLERIEVGADDDGEAITSCYITPSERASTEKASNLPDAAKLALRLLAEGLADQGTIPPTNAHIPPDIRTIAQDVWREYCYRGSISESDNPDTRYKAFVRAAKKLQTLGFIGIWNDQVWLAGHAGH